jgi:hypothetical protein
MVIVDLEHLPFATEETSYDSRNSTNPVRKPTIEQHD